MIKNTEKNLAAKNNQEKYQPQYLKINQQNGMTRIYCVTKIDAQKTTIYFEQLLEQS